MELAHEGLTLWFDTADAPLGPRSVTVGVRPVHPGNAVTVSYRGLGSDGEVGFTRQIAAAALPGGPRAGAQYFQALLPAGDLGAIEVLPVLTCAGRQVPASARASEWRRCPLPAAVPVQPAPIAVLGSPRFSYQMDFLGTVTAFLAKPPETIGVVPQGLRRTFYIKDGSCVGPKLNARIRAVGADWMLIQRDGVALPNVRTTWETTDGALLYGEYSGTFDLGPEGYERALRDEFPTLPVVQLAPRFVTAHPRWEWLNRVQCVGIGQVDMNKLEVGYDLYAVRGGHAIRNTGGTR